MVAAGTMIYSDHRVVDDRCNLVLLPLPSGGKMMVGFPRGDGCPFAIYQIELALREMLPHLSDLSNPCALSRTDGCLWPDA